MEIGNISPVNNSSTKQNPGTLVFALGPNEEAQGTQSDIIKPVNQSEASEGNPSQTSGRSNPQAKIDLTA